MALLPALTQLSNGQVAQATDVQGNFDIIRNDYNGNITNDNLSASAAIADSKLAQITTASKVSGVALTAFASITSAAGIIPLANYATGTSATMLVALNTAGGLPAVDGSLLTNLAALNVKVGNFNIDTSLATGTTSYVSGLGFTPKAVFFLANQSQTREMSIGVDDGTKVVSLLCFSSGIFDMDITTDSIWDMETASSASYHGHITSKGNGFFVVTWAQTGSPTGTLYVGYLAIG